MKPKGLSDFPAYVEAKRRHDAAVAERDATERALNKALSASHENATNAATAKAERYLADGTIPKEAPEGSRERELTDLRERRAVLEEAVTLARKALETATFTASKDILEAARPEWDSLCRETAGVIVRLAELEAQRMARLAAWEAAGVRGTTTYLPMIHTFGLGRLADPFSWINAILKDAAEQGIEVHPGATKRAA